MSQMFQFAQRSASKTASSAKSFVDATRAARPSRLRFYDASTLPWRDYSILVFVIFDYRDLGLVVARVVIASLYLSS